ncbi:MAG TPA: diguanylate cyclase response regulator, partial [Pseudomonas sp.]|nr:diguanylate cyclase response regulator [Pseudomonas sp.]
ACKVLNEIRQRFAEIRFPAQPRDLSCTFSCGITELTADAEVKTLTQQADEALYRAKHAGRNRVERY